LSLTNPGVFGAAAALLVLVLLKRRQKSKQNLPYPPGPPPLPLIGNVLDMPRSKFALTWTKFGEKYGPLTWLTIPGQTVLVINSFEAAQELLDKRGSVFSDRPRFTMLSELLGMGEYAVFSGYTANWRTQRAYLKHALSAPVIRSDYSLLLEAGARQFLGRCLVRSEDFLIETERIAAEIITKLTYGRLKDERGRDYIETNTYVTSIVEKAVGGYLVDLLPALRYLPSWLPGMKFKQDAARWKREIDEFRFTTFEVARADTVSKLSLQELYRKVEDGNDGGRDVQQETEEEIAISRSALTQPWSKVQLTIESFILAMTLFPSVQERARAEIDRVVGLGRFPAFSDQPDLPYLHAVVLETMRWSPVASFGIPHASSTDDVYDGYFIPKGTTVIVNAWGISRNSKYYTNPTIFDPERHLKQTPELDPREFGFGYGRRVCPGKDLAFQEVWIFAASILWAFEL
ncbi:hypothetical protein M407DRAFT_39782, partial [Tulasnella calospora MUT 4182]